MKGPRSSQGRMVLSTFSPQRNIYNVERCPVIYIILLSRKFANSALPFTHHRRLPATKKVKQCLVFDRDVTESKQPTLIGNELAHLSGDSGCLLGERRGLVVHFGLITNHKKCTSHHAPSSRQLTSSSSSSTSSSSSSTTLAAAFDRLAGAAAPPFL